MKPLEQEPVMAAAQPERALRVSAGNSDLKTLIQRLMKVAQEGLGRMFVPEQGQFAFTRKRQADGTVRLEGTSPRYGAICVLGGQHLEEAAQRLIFGGRSAGEFAQQLVKGLDDNTDLGTRALVTWAAAEMSLPQVEEAIEGLRRGNRTSCDAQTVEAAWVLSALVAARGQANVKDLARQARDRLLGVASLHNGIFPHWTNVRAAPWYRRHVACFADQVYPIQALARYHKAWAYGPALVAAGRCAEQICRMQGRGGQWWWHYDCRSGGVIEGYPVYTVHQDAMAPMALLDLAEAGGGSHYDAIRLGLSWMIRAPEVDRCLIDEDLGLIWRSVQRRAGRKFRAARAVMSRVHLRLRVLERLLRPTVIDYEDRPYHLGWILHTWLGGL